MRTNGEAVYGTSGFRMKKLWQQGRITQKPGKLYASIFVWPSTGSLTIPISANVKSAALLSEPGRSLPFTVGPEGVQVAIAGVTPDPRATVLVLEVDGQAKDLGQVPALDAEALAESFDLSRFGRAPAKFDEAELHRINAQIVHQLPFARVAHLLPEGMGEAGWEAIRPNLAHIGEAADWWQVVTGPVAAPALGDEDRAYLATAAEALAGQGWGDNPWGALTASLKERTGRKGKALFLPLRLALTGREHGPDMAALLPLIGQDAALARLRAAV